MWRSTLLGYNLNNFDLYLKHVLCLISQDTPLPKKSSGQVFMGIWLLFSLVVTISYVSNLTAFMTIPAFSSTINSLDELSRSDYGWGVTSYGAADYQLLKTSTVSVWDRLLTSLVYQR